MFEQVFPYYLAIGMSERQFWDGPPELAKGYRQADRLRRERRNEELWLQGMYIYEAILDAAPVLRAFEKRPKPRPYPKQPYDLGLDRRRAEQREEDQDRQARASMEAFMLSFNAGLKKRGGETDGGEHRAAGAGISNHREQHSGSGGAG